MQGLSSVTTPPGRRAVVIGSGFGGLAAAVRLAARGWAVTVLERHHQPGGRARVFRQDGFTFDAGPTVITAPFLFEELWTLCGKRMADTIDLRPVDPFYRIRFDDGVTFEYTGDAERMRAEVARLSPGDSDGYERFLAMSAAIFDVGFDRLAHVPFSTWLDMARIVPEMVRLESFRTVHGLVSKFVRSERLRQILSFHPLLVGGNPFRTTSIYSLIPHLERKWGVHFPMGGTGALVRGLVELAEGAGAVFRYGATVDRIVVEEGRARGVTLIGGELLPADIVVSNADSAWTYRNLLGGERRRRWTDQRLDRARYSMSLFVWYFGTRRQYPDIAHHTILLGPRYRELLGDIFDRKVVAEDFSLYLHAPTRTDPSLAPPGCETFYVLSPVPNLGGGQDWDAIKDEYCDRILASLEKEHLVPDLRKHLVTLRMFTPKVFETDLDAFKGSAFQFEPVLTQSAWFRPHNRSEDVGNLFFVGAGTHPGAGLPGVISSAKVLEKWL